MKTTHQLARELLALPDMPVFHFDPSFVDACDEETDRTLGTPVVAIDDPKEDLDEREIADAEANGFSMEKFVTISGDQPEEYDRGEWEEQQKAEGFGAE